MTGRVHPLPRMKTLTPIAVRPPVSGFIFVELGADGLPIFQVTNQVLELRAGTEGPPALRYQQHPLMAEHDGPLRELAIELPFNVPAHNIFARYEAWHDQVSEQPMCRGDGARGLLTRRADGAVMPVACAGPAFCQVAACSELNCRIQVGMLVKYAGTLFEFRSNSESTLNALRGGMDLAIATAGGLRGVKLILRGWVRATKASGTVPFACARLDIASDAGALVAAPEPDAMEEYGSQLQRAYAAELDAPPSLPDVVGDVPRMGPVPAHRRPAANAALSIGAKNANDGGVDDLLAGLIPARAAQA